MENVSLCLKLRYYEYAPYYALLLILMFTILCSRKSTVKYPVDAELDSSSQYQSSGGTTVISETADTADIVMGSSDKR